MNLKINFDERELVTSNPQVFLTIGDEESHIPKALPITVEELATGTYTKDQIEKIQNIVSESLGIYLTELKMKNAGDRCEVRTNDN